MVHKPFDGARGRVERVWFDSQLLNNNPLGDPTRREVGVYLPAGYDEETSRHYPVLFDLAGYTGSGLSHLAWKNFSENIPERLDRLIATAQLGPVIVVFPDFFTSLGGNQYINSSALGPYGDVLNKELVPFIDGQFRSASSRQHRGLFGKSSGGYGSLVHGMRNAETWGAIACHSGDMYFEFGYWFDFPILLNTLASHDRSVEKFLAHFRSRDKHKGDEIHTLMLIAMAASYDPDPETNLGYHLPVDLYTGERLEERWKRWLRHDPIHLLESCRDNLEKLALLYIDCGFRDQYHLHYGSRILCKKLENYEIPHYYEEFNDNHSSIDYRLDVSLPMLESALRVDK